MSLNEVSAEKLAEIFHHYHQALGPDFGCTVEAKCGSWQEVSKPERSRMVAAARLTLVGTGHAANSRRKSKPVFCPGWRGRMGLLAS
jgi:hypothetical protein